VEFDLKSEMKTMAQIKRGGEGIKRKKMALRGEKGGGGDSGSKQTEAPKMLP